MKNLILSYYYLIAILKKCKLNLGFKKSNNILFVLVIKLYLVFKINYNFRKRIRKWIH